MHAIYLSHSSRNQLRECERKYILRKVNYLPQLNEKADTIDTTFGHAVGAGIADFLIHKSRERALHTAYKNWAYQLLFENKGFKRIETALYAVRLFTELYEEKFSSYSPAAGENSAEWKIILNTAVEKYLCKYIGYIDVVLEKENKLLPIEIKTSSTHFSPDLYTFRHQHIGYAYALKKAYPEKEILPTLYIHFTVAKGEVSISFHSYENTEKKELEFKETLLRDFRRIAEILKTGIALPNQDRCYSWGSQCPILGECDKTFKVFPKPEDQKKIGLVIEEEL